MILCCGEAVIDMIPADDGEAALAFRPVTGGAAVNTAIALARLDQKAGFFGALSSDEFGDMLSAALLREGVDTAHAPVLDAPTTKAFVRLSGDTQTFSFEDENSAGRALSLAHMPPLEEVDALVFGGLSLIRKPAAGVFEALQHMAGESRLVLLDANIRPALIGDCAQEYRQRLNRMIRMADILKFSDEDRDWLKPDPPEQLLQGRASMVLHTHGPDGATLYSRHGRRHLPASAVHVADTVGAGDTFNAGVLAALARQGVLSPAALARSDHATLTRAVALGIRAATFSVTRMGANPPTTKDLQ